MQVADMVCKTVSLYAHHTGQDIDRIARDTARVDWLSAADAQTYGLIGAIQTSTRAE